MKKILGFGFFARIFEVSLKLLMCLIDAGRAINDAWHLVLGSFSHRC